MNIDVVFHGLNIDFALKTYNLHVEGALRPSLRIEIWKRLEGLDL